MNFSCTQKQPAASRRVPAGLAAFPGVAAEFVTKRQVADIHLCSSAASGLGRYCRRIIAGEERRSVNCQILSTPKCQNLICHQVVKWSGHRVERLSRVGAACFQSYWHL